MTVDPTEADVVVVGAGPAGAVCAISLARLGLRVTVCEAAAFPRHHVGVCLAPGVASQLDFLGLAHLLERPAYRSHPMTIRWQSQLFVDSPHEAFVVDRGELDKDLLTSAMADGVKIVQPGHVLELLKSEDHWNVKVRTPSEVLRLKSRFVVDARGRNSAGRRTPIGAPTIAIHAELSCGAYNRVRLSASENSWSWLAPLASGNALGVAFAAPSQFHRMPGSLTDRYLRLLSEADLIGPNAEPLSAPTVCDATAYLRTDATESLLRVGDADMALDPLSSSGVQSAVQSALCAAPVINTLLRENADVGAALEYWAQRRAKRAKDHESWSSQRYREAFAVRDTEFWRTRAPAQPEERSRGEYASPLPRPDQSIALSPEAVIIKAACLEGTFVVRKECLLHPRLSEPIAYVDGLLLAPMLRVLEERKSAAEVIAIWKPLCAPTKGLAILQWLWQRQIAIAV